MCIITVHQYSHNAHLLRCPFSLLVHSSQVKTSSEEVRSKLTEDNASCKVYLPVNFMYGVIIFKGFKYSFSNKLYNIALKQSHTGCK